ncbi:uncharacterized protein [Lepeophtheirus salmonis]|uniref:uncharacterized protein isoform X2 n=1 Tax=Lepeophtheirus salmonis TaxID=72036 RepID=UPI00077F2DA6|nr:extracellular ribonuclease LE-like isoform X2 [Lepeophtheirus salmonis]
MIPRIFISLWVLWLSISYVGAYEHKEFDFLYFTQVWPQSACVKWKDSSKNHTCNMNNGADWSIHGVWPTKNMTIGPLYCNNTTKFDPKALKDILSELEAHWIDVHGGSHDKYGFWKHEYMKHGTCAADIFSMSTEYLYFLKGLELHAKYDISNLLRKGGVYQGSSYDAEAFINAVKSSLGGFTPALECEKNKEGHYLYQLGICMDKTFQLINCDRIAGGVYGNCPKETNSLIKYPYGPQSRSHIYAWFIGIFFLCIFGGIAYYLYHRYINHRRLSEYNRL